MIKLKEKILRPNKIKWAFILIPFLAFFSFSIFMIFFYPRIDGKVMGGGVSLLISAALLFLLYKTPFWKPTIILSQDGVYINNLPLNESMHIGKRYSWKDIKSVSKFRQWVPLIRFPYFIFQNYIVIYLNSSTNDFSNDKDNVFFKKRYGEMMKGNQILIPNNFLPHFSVNKNLRIFSEYPVRME